MKARRYVEAQGAPWYILSAKHGLVDPEATVKPYELTLNTMQASQRRTWAGQVLASLAEVLPPAGTVVFLAGQRYREHLIAPLLERGHTLEIPMEGLGIGRQLQWLTRQLVP